MDTKRIRRGKEGENCDLKFRKTKEIFFKELIYPVLEIEGRSVWVLARKLIGTIITHLVTSSEK